MRFLRPFNPASRRGDRCSSRVDPFVGPQPAPDILPRTISTTSEPRSLRPIRRGRQTTGAAGHFLSVGLPRRAPAAPRNRPLACTLHGPPALCGERGESAASAIPARRRARRAPEPPVGKVRNEYRMAPRSMVFTNRSLSRWGKRRTENRATERPAFFERSARLSAENAACSVSRGVHARRAPRSRLISSAVSSEGSRDGKPSTDRGRDAGGDQ
jgi:hypothetical protein